MREFAAYGLVVDLSDLAGVLQIEAIDDAGRSCADEIAPAHADIGSMHGRLARALGEHGLEFDADAAGLLPDVRHGLGIGDRQRTAGCNFRLGLLRSMHERHAHAETVQQAQVEDDVRQIAGSKRLAMQQYDERPAAVGVDIRRCRAEQFDRVVAVLHCFMPANSVDLPVRAIP